MANLTGVFLYGSRWLIAKDRHEEAQADKQDGENLQQEGITHWCNFFDLSVLVKSRSRRYRLMLNLVFSWFGQILWE
ncbi:hypothetical protein ETB97_010455 [Aspergillus alliaceus]|uniref:Uncharacterized protein n=1 Tax=Petromyces alliaceus TaxID=209559 RepID=A0A8H6A7N0_PETAA|nr:hypothetical protein ETB97_010455 [Aspergillus burnettii]